MDRIGLDAPRLASQGPIPMIINCLYYAEGGTILYKTVPPLKIDTVESNRIESNPEKIPCRQSHLKENRHRAVCFTNRHELNGDLPISIAIKYKYKYKYKCTPILHFPAAVLDSEGH